MSRPVRVRSSPSRKLSKNFPVNQELDADLWIEFLGTVGHQNWAAWRVSKKRADTVGEPSLSAGCSWGAGYGIIRAPISVMPTLTQPKDICYVAPPACHCACPGSNRPCSPCSLSQRPSLSHVP